MKYGLRVLLIVILTSIQTVQADYIFSAPPREGAMTGITIYGPLVQKLNQVLGEKVLYEQPGNWLEYSKKMRNGEYDIVFDGPHFNAWRVKHLGHILVASLPGTLQFHLITYKQFLAVNTSQDLVGRAICAMPSPNLGTDMVLSLFQNPSVQPQIFEVKGGFRKMYESFKQGNCLATIMRVDMFNNLLPAEKDKLKIIATTQALPNQTFSISKRLKNKAGKLAKFLLSDEGSSAGQKILERYARGATHFVRAESGKFAGAEYLLENIVFGW
jgi:ABC-type phosphate/phosphonate transport system substrate-binding protein